MPCAIWASANTGINTVSSTNTYYWANSPDGVTLCTTNLWTTTLIIPIGTAGGTNTGYQYINPTNYTGAKGFGLLFVAVGGTNTCTNTQIIVSWPE
jgi:hypothetical protein